MMLENIRQDHGEAVAMEVLDSLRALRQTYPSIRMVYTGSIGLHHVIGSLRTMGYSNAPKNDMATIDVPPLTTVDAQRLAELLLSGENIVIADRAQMALCIVQAVDAVPFYIHHVVARLKRIHGTITAETIEQIVMECLMDGQDRWDMSHFRSRLDTYYAVEERTLALQLLDVLAIADQPLPDREMFNLLAARMEIMDKERARAVLILLMRDHYVIQKPVGAYRFYLPLIRRWWRNHRGLDS